MRNLCSCVPCRPQPAIRFWIRILSSLSISGLVGCPPPPPPGGTVRPNLGRVELAPYDAATLKADPSGGAGTIVAGRILVDFQNSVTLEAIDAALGRHGLRRIGIVGSINLVTAEITDGRGELEAQAAIETESTVDGAPLAYVTEDESVAGEAPPVIAPFPAGGVPETLGDVALNANWHHYVMDTFPAHALVEAVRGTQLADVEIAVVDAGFQTQSGAEAVGSLYADPVDTDLRGKTLGPVALARRPDNTIEVVEGSADVSSNALLSVSFWKDGQVVTALHGQACASAAVGAGQEVLGTGKHCRLRPVHKALNGPPDAQGRPTAMRSLDYAAAVLLYLDEHASPNLRVISMSWGYEIESDDQSRRAQRALWDALLGHELNGRLMVTSAGNDLINMGKLVPKRLSIPRNPAAAFNQNDLLYRFSNMMVVTGSRFPVKSAALGGVFGLLDYDGLSEERFQVGVFGSNFGEAASVCGPAQEVSVLFKGLDAPAQRMGTSYAAPLVAGLAGEMFAVDASLTASEAIDILQRTSDDLAGADGAPGWDAFFGHGRVNCWKAILAVLNRGAPESPQWLGVRFRTPLSAISPAQVWIDGQPVADTRIKRVRDIVSAPGGTVDQTREVPFASTLPTLRSTLFSLQPGSLSPATLGHVPVIELRDAAGAVQYQIPFLSKDWLGAVPRGSSVDDYVVTLEPRDVTAAVYGRVLNGPSPVAGANVRYERFNGEVAFVYSDENGYYAAYDARPDEAFEMDAASAGSTTAARSVMVPALRAMQVDFQFDTASACELAGALPAWSSEFLFERYTEQTPGVPLINTTNVGETGIVLTGPQSRPTIHFRHSGAKALDSYGNGPVFNYAIAAQGGACILSPVNYGDYGIVGAPRNPAYVYSPDDFPLIAPPLLRGEPYRVSLRSLKNPSDPNSAQSTALVYFSLPPCPDTQQDCDCDNVGRTPGIAPFDTQSFLFVEGTSRPGIGSAVCRLGLTLSGTRVSPTLDWIGGAAFEIVVSPVGQSTCNQQFRLVRAPNSTATIAPPWQYPNVPTGFVRSCPGSAGTSSPTLTSGQEYIASVYYEAVPSSSTVWYLRFRVR